MLQLAEATAVDVCDTSTPDEPIRDDGEMDVLPSYGSWTLPDGYSVLEDGAIVDEEPASNALKNDAVGGLVAQSSANVLVGVAAGARRSTFPTWINSIASHGASGFTSFLGPWGEEEEGVKLNLPNFEIG